MNLPVAVGDRIEVLVEDLGTSGDGVARYRDYVLFVEGGVPGDRVIAEVRSTGSSFGRCGIREFLQYSEERDDPRCRYYGACGGCQLQHVSYGAERLFKKHWVEQAFQRIADGGDARVDPTAGTGDLYGYRHRTRFSALVAEDGGVRTCFHRRDGAGLLPVSRCEVQADRANGLLGELVPLLADPDLVSGPDWDGISINVAGDEALLVLGTGTGAWDGGATLARELMDGVDGLVGVVRNVALPADRKARRPGALNLPLAGRDHLNFEEAGYTLRASAGVFSQINPAAAELVYDKVLEVADVGPGDTVVELFSGIGVLSLRLAGEGAFVLGVDMDGGAVADARSNAASNDCDAVVHLNADAAEGLSRSLSTGTRPDVLVVDPPRGGCSRKLLDLVVSSGARRMVYVSCHYGTWARDLRYLSREGWECREAMPVDMFPRTTSVELVSVIEPSRGV